MLSKLEREFAVYAQSFFTGEESIDRNLRLKLAHSFRVRNEMRRLAQAESFSPEETRGALRTALLHDLSRFEQFQRFHSFNDAESFDHGDRSAELAASGDWLEGFGPEERDAILTAIRVHNKLAIPPGLPELALLWSRAIRDADKLDIIPILLGYLEDPENESIVFGLSEKPELSALVLESIRRGGVPAPSRYADRLRLRGVEVPVGERSEFQLEPGRIPAPRLSRPDHGASSSDSSVPAAP